jgi:hypothetical protein
MNQPQAAPPPALFDHCMDVYNEMLKTAVKKDGQLTWEGALTRVVSSLGLSTPYYSHVTKALKAMDCIRQTRRGGGGTESVWVMLQKPTPTLWESLAKPALAAPAKKEVERDQRDRDLLHRISTLENRVTILEGKNA